MNKLYQETILNDCRISKNLLRTKLVRIVNNPELVVPLLFTEKETFARVVGKALYSFSCTPVPVSITKISYRKNQKWNNF